MKNILKITCNCLVAVIALAFICTSIMAEPSILDIASASSLSLAGVAIMYRPMIAKQDSPTPPSEHYDYVEEVFLRFMNQEWGTNPFTLNYNIGSVDASKVSVSFLEFSDGEFIKKYETQFTIVGESITSISVPEELIPKYDNNTYFDGLNLLVEIDNVIEGQGTFVFDTK